MKALNHFMGFNLSKLLTAVGLFSGFLAWPALAQTPKFGAEFTITSPEVKSTAFGPNREYLAKMRRMHEEMCKSVGCVVADALDAYRLEFKDGFWLHVGVDQYCLEINAKPSTVKEYHAAARNIQWFIFDVGAQFGLFPHEMTGQGHIHMSADVFKVGTAEEDIKLFRNFLVDRFNHPELDMALSRDMYNSPPLAAQSDEQIKAFADLVDRIDRGELTTIKAIALALENEVYKIGTHPLNWAPLEKYQAVNVARLVNKKKKYDLEDMTVELRSVTAQRNAREFILQTEMLNRRLQWLKNQPLLAFDGLKIKSRITEKEIDRNFKLRLEEVGLRNDEFKELNRFNYIGNPMMSVEDLVSIGRAVKDFTKKLIPLSCKKLGPALVAFPNE